MFSKAGTMKSVLQGVWGTPHQAKGGDSSESPPAVFWLQKTLLANFQSLSVSLIVKKTFHLTFLVLHETELVLTRKNAEVLAEYPIIE